MRWQRVGFSGKQIPQFGLCTFRESSQAKKYLTITVSLKWKMRWGGIIGSGRKNVSGHICIQASSSVTSILSKGGRTVSHPIFSRSSRPSRPPSLARWAQGSSSSSNSLCKCLWNLGIVGIYSSNAVGPTPRSDIIWWEMVVVGFIENPLLYLPWVMLLFIPNPGKQEQSWIDLE